MSKDPSTISSLFKLARDIDFRQIAQLAEKVDLGELIAVVSSLDDSSLAQMKKMAKRGKGERELPEINADFYDIAELLTEEQRDLQKRTRAFMEEKVEPVINEYYQRDETPVELLRDGILELGIIDALYDEGGNRRPGSSVTEGIITMEIANVDVSTATFLGVHSGLAMGSVMLGASDEQKAEWMPKLQSMEWIGAFGLTEPYVGSAAAGGLQTTCKREGDEWVLNGQKKWIGNATFADVVIIWARDEDEGGVRGFLVRTDNPGYAVEKIMNKIALRAVENGLVTLTECRIPESDRLQKVESFKDTAEVLRLTRAGVAWLAVGCAMGAYEKALEYAQTRKQFGQAIGNFQLIQRLLVEMLGNVTALQSMCLRLSQLQDAGRMGDEHASLAKVFCAARCRDTVAMARELFGGNGILLDHHVARYFADAEAIYSYEGTNEINTLIVGRAVTGFGAFV
ncbi:acyl-CoA dehydrogenase family protein [soil metagenome]